MEFKKIQLNGFKSFADKTNFLIEDGLTGIVGTFFVKDYLNLSAAFLAGLGFWVLCIPLAYFVMRDKPKDYGLNPDGDIDEVQEEQGNVTVKRIPFKRILWRYYKL